MKNKGKKQMTEQELTKNVKSGLWGIGDYQVDDMFLTLDSALVKYKRNSKKNPGSNLASFGTAQYLGKGSFGAVYSLQDLSWSGGTVLKERVVKLFALKRATAAIEFKSYVEEVDFQQRDEGIDVSIYEAQGSVLNKMPAAHIASGSYADASASTYEANKSVSDRMPTDEITFGSSVRVLDSDERPIVPIIRNSYGFPVNFVRPLNKNNKCPWAMSDFIKNEYKFAKLTPHLGVKKLVIGESHVCLVMKRMPGETLMTLRKTTADLGLIQKLQFILAVLKAVKSQVHDKGIIHRDISPHNIMVKLEPEIEVNIIDFGLASKADENDGSWRRGNKAYGSPEYFKRQAITQKSDIFMVGRSLALALTNDSSMYTARNNFEYAAHADNAADAISIPELPELETFFKRILHKDPAKRFSVDEAIRAIKDIIFNVSNSTSKAGEASSSTEKHGFFKRVFNKMRKGKMPAKQDNHLIKVNKARNDDVTTLFMASQNGRIDVVNALIKAGADINKARNDGVTALLLAAKNGHLDIVLALINAGAEVNKAANNGATALLLAAQGGHLDVVNALIKAGAEVNKAAGNGGTALFMASQNGYIDVVHVLIKAGAEVDKAVDDGATALFMASQNGYIDIVNVLINAGADINKARNDGTTALFIASQNGYIDIVNVLIEAGAEIDKAKNNDATALFIAVETGHVDIVRALIAAGANVNKTRNDGATVLFIAVWNGHIDIARALIEAGADINKARNDGVTVLDMAEQSGHLEMIHILTKRPGVKTFFTASANGAGSGQAGCSGNDPDNGSKPTV